MKTTQYDNPPIGCYVDESSGSADDCNRRTIKFAQGDSKPTNPIKEMKTTKQAKLHVHDKDGTPGIIEYGWHYIEGNSGAYFAVTAWFGGGRNGYGGACHDTIAELAPSMIPLIALHLSDAETGEPMHPEANGWYWLSATLPGNAGERYTGGGNGSTAKTQDECLQIFAAHCRITIQEAQTIRDRFTAMLATHEPDSVGFPALCKAARKAFAGEIELMRPRWKAEADAERQRLAAMNPQAFA